MPRASSPTSDALVDTWGRRNRALDDKVCPNCGASFRPLRSASKYCSRPCMWANNGGQNAKQECWWINGNGYVEGRDWENGRQRRVKKHRHEREKHHGRGAMPNEADHHKNGIKTDNRIENLQVLEHAEHTRVTNAGRDYRRGYRMNLTDDERRARSARMKEMRATGGSNA